MMIYIDKLYFFKTIKKSMNKRIIDILFLKFHKDRFLNTDENISAPNPVVREPSKNDSTKEDKKKVKNVLMHEDAVVLELYPVHNYFYIQWGNDVAINKYGDKIIGVPIIFLIDKEIWLDFIFNLTKFGTDSSYPVEIMGEEYNLFCSLPYQYSDLKSIYIVCQKVGSVSESTEREIQTDRGKEVRYYSMTDKSEQDSLAEVYEMITHQLKQPISAMLSVTNSLKIKNLMDMYNKEEFDDAFNRIMLYSEHLTETMNTFGGFFKTDKIKHSDKLKDIVNNVVIMMSDQLREKNIIVEKNYLTDTSVCTYMDELKQVIINLFQNAIDELINNKITTPVIRVSIYDNQKQVVLEIEDNAGGIDEKNIDKVFDIHFTTKGQYGGTGMGLFMSKIVIENHCRGSIDVRNTDTGLCVKVVIDAK